MVTVNGCEFPDALLYAINADRNLFVWLQEHPNGTFTTGMVAVAAAMAGELVSYTPTRVGRTVARFRSLAVVESSKWVGPVPAPLSCEVVGTNDDIRAQPSLANADPYGRGWVARIRPTKLVEERGDLVPAEQAAETMRSILIDKDIWCE